MKMESFYEELYRKSQEKTTELCYRIGYMEESLSRLRFLIEKGWVTADQFNTSQLDNIVNASKLAKESYEEYQKSQKVKEASR